MNPPVDNNAGKISCMVCTVNEDKLGQLKHQFEDDILLTPYLSYCWIFYCWESEAYSMTKHNHKSCLVPLKMLPLPVKILALTMKHSWARLYARLKPLKGKTVCKAPIRVKEDYIDIPPKLEAKHSNLELCMDIMFVYGMPMLTSTDHSINFRSFELLSRCLSKIFCH